MAEATEEFPSSHWRPPGASRERPLLHQRPHPKSSMTTWAKRAATPPPLINPHPTTIHPGMVTNTQYGLFSLILDNSPGRGFGLAMRTSSSKQIQCFNNYRDWRQPSDEDIFSYLELEVGLSQKTVRFEVRISQNTIKIVRRAFTKIDCESVTLPWKHPVKPRREKGVRGRFRSTSLSFSQPPPILILLTIIIACLIKMSECLPASVPPLSPEETLTGKQCRNSTNARRYFDLGRPV